MVVKRDTWQPHGLKDALLDIATDGLDPWGEGQSPLVKARPIVNHPSFVRQTGGAVKNVVVDRPTTTSSAATSHPPSMANDGDGARYWQAAQAGAGAPWSVDLEEIYAVRGVEFAPHAQAEPAFVVEASRDRNSGKTDAHASAHRRRRQERQRAGHEASRDAPSARGNANFVSRLDDYRYCGVSAMLGQFRSAIREREKRQWQVGRRILLGEHVAQLA